MALHLGLALVLADEQPEAACADDEQPPANGPKAPTALCAEAVLHNRDLHVGRPTLRASDSSSSF